VLKITSNLTRSQDSESKCTLFKYILTFNNKYFHSIYPTHFQIDPKHEARKIVVSRYSKHLSLLENPITGTASFTKLFIRNQMLHRTKQYRMIPMQHTPSDRLSAQYCLYLID
jgi:hypothetical protein